MRVRRTLVLAAASLAVALVGSALRAAEEAKVRCPVKGIEFQPTEKTKWVTVNEQKVGFC